MTIRLLLTGGTFDKSYNIINEKLEHNTSHIHEMLEVSRSTCDVQVTELFLKDSHYFTQEDRARIVDACKDAVEDQIIITHGTSTMVETAKAIAGANLSKTIVLTGALVPYSLGIKSDAMFNLGNAIAFVQLLPQGVYIAINGRYFNADKAHKDAATGFFVGD